MYTVEVIDMEGRVFDGKVAIRNGLNSLVVPRFEVVQSERKVFDYRHLHTRNKGVVIHTTISHEDATKFALETQPDNIIMFHVPFDRSLDHLLHLLQL
jgi:hypothetical protein